MKKIFLNLGLIVLVLFCAKDINAQTATDSKWVISAGAGTTISETADFGFAHNEYIGYKFAKVLEAGISFDHGIRQTKGGPISSQQSIYVDQSNSDHSFDHITIPVDEKGNEFIAGNLFSATFSLGINPLNFIEDCRHGLLISGFVGYGARSFSSISRSELGAIAMSRTNVVVSTGVKASYEYLINNRIGVGASGSYDFGLEAINALAKLYIHF